jgi:hypothetical protein
MKSTKYILFLSLILTILSCNDKPQKRVKLEILCDKLNDDELNELKELITPIEINDTCVVFNPVVFKRLDRNDNKKLSYLESKKLNFEKISAVKTSLNNNFKNDIITYLKSEMKNDYNIELITSQYKNNGEFFSYKKDSEENDVYNEVDKLKSSINTILFKKNINKIIIAYNITYNVNRNPIEVVDSPIVKKPTPSSGGPIPMPPKDSPVSDGCNQKLSATDVQDFISKLSNVNYLLTCREVLRDRYIYKFFNNNAKVYILNNNGDKINNFSIKSFTQQLMTSHRPYRVEDIEDINGKITIINLSTL